MKDGIFDPRDVYLWGTLLEGACYKDAIAHWSNPDHYVIGFPCGYADDGNVSSLASMWIRPSDGRLLWIRNNRGQSQVLAFVSDGYDISLTDYPHHTQANDLPVTAACDASIEFFADPGGGELVYHCPNPDRSSRYYRESGAEYPVPDGYELVHLGLDGSAVLADLDDAWTVLTPSGELIALGRQFPAQTVRAHDAGFWVVEWTDVNLAPRRWNIGLDGTLTDEGTYAPLPEGMKFRASVDAHGSAVDGEGRLLCFAQGPDWLDDRIVRTELDVKQGEVVYDELTNPKVQVHNSKLVTGP